MTRNTYIIFAAIILGATGWYIWSSSKNVENIAENQPANTTTGLLVGKNTIYVSEQLPSMNIMIGLAVLEKPGFVVVHESVNSLPAQVGKPGAIIGKSAHLTSGEHKNIIVPLSRISKDDEKIFAMIHVDDGNGVFDAAKDVPAKAENGEPIMMEFMVRNDASAPGEIKL